MVIVIIDYEKTSDSTTCPYPEQISNRLRCATNQKFLMGALTVYEFNTYLQARLSHASCHVLSVWLSSHYSFACFYFVVLFSQ